MKAYLPENLDLELIIKKNPPEFSYHIDNFYYIIGLIAREKSQDRRLRHKNFIPLYTKLLKERIWDYKRYLDYLRQAGIFIRVGGYEPGSHSCKYGFTKKYRHQEVVPIKIMKYTLRKNLSKIPRVVKDYQKGVIKTYPYEKWMKKLEIDLDPINKNLEWRFRRAKKNDWSKAIGKLNCYRVCTQRIADKDTYFRCDTTSGRAHTSLTSLPSQYRKNLSRDGKFLECVDMSNCQLLLLTILYDPSFYHSTLSDEKFSINNLHYVNAEWKKTIQSTINSNSHTILQYTTSVTQPQHSPSSTLSSGLQHIYTSSPQEPHTFPSRAIMVPKNEVSLDSTAFAETYELFVSLTTKGQFFDYFEEQYEKMTGDKFKSRRALKKRVFGIIYSQNSTKNAVKDLFYKLFPFARMLELYKIQTHKTLPILMQIIEANLFLDRICMRLYREHHRMPFWTIHDGIACRVGDGQIIQQIILEETEKVIGLIPAVEIEFWGRK